VQEQPFPQASSSESLTNPRQAAVRLARGRQVPPALTAVGILAFALLLVGCTAVVDDKTPPDMMATGGSAGNSAGATSSNAGSANCDEAPCVAQVFGATRCAICHQSKGMDMGGLKAAGLDLQSPNPSTRLRGVPATHGELPMGKDTGCPTGDFLVDMSNAADSWLWKKINGQQGTCGDSMPPPGVPFSSTDSACIETYIECLTGMPLTPVVGGGVGSAGTASGGGGGAGGANSGGGGAGGVGGG
jgi:hypothetical protein